AGPPKLFVRLIGTQNDALFMPIGLVFMARDKGKRLFQNTPIVTQSLPRETYRIGGCVSDLAFAIPPKLDGVERTILVEPSPLFRPIRAIADVDAFMKESDPKPVTLVLL